jgi:hypothetical protein
MKPESPTTVTFNPRPEDEAQFRSARLGSRVVGYLVAVPAGLCLLVAGGHNLTYAASVGGSVPEQLALCLISLALTGCVGGRLVASALLASTYPQAARQAMSLWGLSIWISAISAFYFVATREWALADAPPPGTSIAWVAAGLFDERQARAFFTLLFALALRAAAAPRGARLGRELAPRHRAGALGFRADPCCRLSPHRCRAAGVRLAEP